MDWLSVLFQTIGGLGLFLYGMQKMSDGLKMVASDRIRNILAHLTSNRVIALLVGTGVTALVQSSSATTVMTVGFVNAGLMTLQQAVSVILGANIGTTFTAWLVSIIGKFKIANYALPVIGTGFFMLGFAKKRRIKEWGYIVFGFGLIFFGLDILKDAFSPIKKSEFVINMFANFSSNPILGILVGTVFTMILQSSSATIAIVQVLAFNGVISFEAAIPLILGDNIGTTITAQIASIGTNLNARRTARAHMLFNGLGVLLLLPIVWPGYYGSFIEAIFPGEITKTNIMAHIAVSHSVFNILNAIFFTIFINFLVKASKSLTKDKKGKIDRQPQYLEENLLDNPVLAMEQVIKELSQMISVAEDTVKNAQKGFFTKNEKLLNEADEGEEALDEFQRAITLYLVKISEKDLNTRESMEYPILLHSVNDLEKIGDYSKNIVSYAHRMIKTKLKMETTSKNHINDMFEKLYMLFGHVSNALKNRSVAEAQKAIKIEDELDAMKSSCRKRYIKRLNQNIGKPEMEMLVMDLASNIEKMGDHLISIAKAVIKDLQWDKPVEKELL